MSEEQGCLGRSGQGRCTAPPQWSVSERMDQSTDYRVCGRHLSWFIARLNRKGYGSVAVARLVRQSGGDRG